MAKKHNPQEEPGTLAALLGVFHLLRSVGFGVALTDVADFHEGNAVIEDHDIHWCFALLKLLF